jgi:hypothetical protein
MQRMFSWLGKNIMNLGIGVLVLLALTMAISAIDKYRDHLPKFPLEVVDFKGGIQNHLVWSMKGECYFVRAVTEQTVLLVRVEDCDKK